MSLRRSWRRLTGILQRDPRVETDEEIRFHVDMRVRDYLARGLTEEEARAAAHRRFGCEEPIRVACVEIERRARAARLRRGWASDLMGDFRFGARILVRAPGFSLTAIVTLAVGIGATTAIFSLFDAVLIAPLPYPRAEQLVQMWTQSPQGDARTRISGANVAEWPEALRSLSSMAAYRTGRTATLTGFDEPQLVVVADVQPAISRVLGVPAFLGRSFVAEDASGGGRVAVVSFSMWERHLGSDSSAVGRTVTLDDLSYLVIGVMPRGFDFPTAGVDLWMPMGTESSGMDPTDRSTHTLLAIGRLRAETTIEVAQAELEAVASGEQEHPETAGWGVNLVPLQQDITARVRFLLTFLLAGVGLVLIVACGNLANLLLARAVGREHEIAVRGALGAGRRRIFRQLLTESLMLAVFGGGTALLVAPILLRGFVAIAPADLPLIDRAGIDVRMFLFAGFLSVACALLFGLAPALHQTRSLSRQALRGARGPALMGHERLRAGLLVTQVSLTFLLMVGAGLFVRSFAALNTVDLGFDEKNLVTMSVVLPYPRYPTTADRARFVDQLLARVSELPRVGSVTGSTGAPGAPEGLYFSFVIEGRDARTSTGREEAQDVVWVAPGYFGVVRQRLLAGRDFDRGDRADAPPVVVINEALRRKLWPDEDPIGQRVSLFGEPGRWREVVGIVEDARLDGVEDEVIPRLYLAYAQHDQEWLNWMTLIVRPPPGTDPAFLHQGMRASLLESDPDLPPRALGTVEQRYRAGMAERRFAMALTVGFGLSALLLSLLGLYGLISFSVAARSREIGLRMALGADQTSVVGTVLRKSLTVAAVGAAIGTLVALAATRAIESMLFGVSPVDGTTYAGTLLVVLLVSAAAASVPAWRAARISPVTALSAE